MKKHLLCLALLLCGALAIPSAAGAAGSADTTHTSGLNCHEMADLWFGVSLLDAGDPASPAAAASDWFARREEDYRDTGTAALLDVDGLESADSVESADSMETADGVDSADRAARLAGIADLQDRAELIITDADVTAQVDHSRTRLNPDGTVTLFVYEWTFLDYDDLSDGVGGSDVMGYGTWHKLTMAQAEEGWEIVLDEYDEEDLLGLCTVTEETRTEPEAALLLAGEQMEAADAAEGIPEDAAEAEEITGEEFVSALLAADFYPGYDPVAASQYADQYALSYNPAWPNYNPIGGDCANFTSQCIYAGRMPMVSGSKGWYHKLNSTSVNSDRSGSWTLARELFNWMSANRGVQLTAADDTVIQGSPVFYVNKGKTAVGHAAICAGYNSAGRPIVDSHNSDKYHAPWDYTKSSPAIYTVQLTGNADLPLSIAGERYPSGNLGRGTGFGLRGVIRSSAIVTRVTADVLDADRNPLPDFHYEAPWDDYRYDIASDGLNDAFIFDQLGAGSYIYMVYAEDAGGAAKTLIESPFAVVDSEITISGETFPSGTLKKGQSFTLRGVIQSALPLSLISAYVYDDTGKPVSDKFQYELKWSSNTYNIRNSGSGVKSINAAFVFDDLDYGTYTYLVQATDSAGTTKTLIEAPFAVSSFSGTMEAPSVKTDGARVVFSWTPLKGAETWTAVLANPETGEPWYEQAAAVLSDGEQTCVLNGIPQGTYDAYVAAYAGEESVQSPTVTVNVGAGGTGSGKASTYAPDITVERATRNDRSIIVTVLITFDWEKRGDAVLAVTAYQGGRLLSCGLVGEIMGNGQSREKMTLMCPAETAFNEDTTVRLFLLDEDTLSPLMPPVEPVFLSEGDP